jgi:dipeptidyl-peptidase 4
MRWIVLLVACPFVAAAQEKKEFSDLRDALFTSFQFGETPGPRSVNWIDGGNRFSYISAVPSTGADQIRTMNPSTLEDTELLGAEPLHFPGTNTAFTYESFQWSHDSKHLVFKSNPQKIFRQSSTADFYVYSLTSKTLTLAARSARSAELSPDGSMVGMVRDGNMVTYDFAAAKETPLTHDAAKNIFNGYYDWVYEEEFGKERAWNWSPDSKYIAYWQFDESKVPVFQMTNFEGFHSDYEKIPILLSVLASSTSIPIKMSG